MFVVSSLDPSRHAKATHIVEVDGLEPEKAEVLEVHPATAVFMASKVLFSNRSSIMLWHRFGMADQGSPCGSERVAIGSRLSDEVASSSDQSIRSEESGEAGSRPRSSGRL
jgi:hypothetical protein